MGVTFSTGGANDSASWSSSTSATSSRSVFLAFAARQSDESHALTPATQRAPITIAFHRGWQLSPRLMVTDSLEQRLAELHPRRPPMNALPFHRPRQIMKIPHPSIKRESSLDRHSLRNWRTPLDFVRFESPKSAGAARFERLVRRANREISDQTPA